MASFQFTLQVIQVVCLVAFGRADIFMAGHVLHFPQVAGLQPVKMEWKKESKRKIQVIIFSTVFVLHF
jgi:hypothetical protein